MEAVQELSEVEWNRYFWDKSMTIIKGDPGRIARLATVKFARMWNPIPNVETYQSLLIRTVSVLWTLPTFLLALIGTYLLWRMENHFSRKILLWLLLPALYYSAIHSLFIGSIRYRLGAIPMLEMLELERISFESVILRQCFTRRWFKRSHLCFKDFYVLVSGNPTCEEHN